MKSIKIEWIGVIYCAYPDIRRVNLGIREDGVIVGKFISEEEYSKMIDTPRKAVDNVYL